MEGRREAAFEAWVLTECVEKGRDRLVRWELHWLHHQLLALIDLHLESCNFSYQ